jgi:hypothetical protein
MLWSVYHAESLPISEEVSSLLNVRHCGIFLNVENPEAYKSDRAGMLYADRTDGMASLLLIAKELHGALVKKGTTFEKLQTLKNVAYHCVRHNAASQCDGVGHQSGWNLLSVGDKYARFICRMRCRAYGNRTLWTDFVHGRRGCPLVLWQLPEGLVLKMTCDFGTG